MKESICKEELLEELHKAIHRRINEASKILDEVQESVDSESQSTAGDKHDTSRELMQQERNKAAQNLQNQIAMDGLLIQLKNTASSNVITFGSLVLTSIGWIFIGLPLGKITFEKCDVLCVSGNSPMAKLLVNGKAGGCIEINNNSIEIIAMK